MTKLLQTITFGTFYYKSSPVEGNCEDWKTFTDISLAVPFDDIYFSFIRAEFEYFDYEKRVDDVFSAYCDWKKPVENIVKHLLTGESYEYNCQGNSC